MSLGFSILAFVVLKYTIVFANDIHIISLSSIVSFAYEHFKIKFHAIGLSIQP
jgi:hypothetical protein